jgi:hypothetical protein
MTCTVPPKGKPKAMVRRSRQLSEPGVPSPARRSHRVSCGVEDDLKARVTAERLQQGLSPQITDLTVLSRLALRLRQASSQHQPAGRTPEHQDGQDGGPVPLMPAPPAGERIPDAPPFTSVPVGRSFEGPDLR